eukprot:5404433-Alexandrium_andersonii.AAC.1
MTREGPAWPPTARPSLAGASGASRGGPAGRALDLRVRQPPADSGPRERPFGPLARLRPQPREH